MRCALVSFDQGLSILKPFASATAFSTREKYSVRAPAQGPIAPWESERSGFGTTSSGSTSKRVPSPLHDGQAPIGRVEREAARGQLVEGDPAVGAGEVLGEGEHLVAVVVLPVVGDEVRESVLGGVGGLGSGGFSRLLRPRPFVFERRCQRHFVVSMTRISAIPSPRRRAVSIESVSRRSMPVAAHQPVDDHLDGVLLVPGELEVGPLGSSISSTVHPGSGEALLRQLVEEGRVLALAPAHDRGEDLEARPLRQVAEAVDDLLRALPCDEAPAVGTMRLADAGEQQAQVVVDLGDRCRRSSGGFAKPTSGRSRSPVRGPR